MTGALHGIRIIDFGQYIAGPLTAMMLGDQGAEVIRVDPPGGPLWKTPANATWNRGKKSIILDLKDVADRDTARRLIAGADVVIENFRPGVMDRLGVGAKEMTAANSRLVYCSMPGFASDDPRASVRAFEGVIAAATDTYRPARAAGADPDRPVYSALPIASNFAAFISATSIVAALIARQRDGLGQRLEVPLFDAMFDAYGRDPDARRGRDGAGPRDPRGGGSYQCRDGRWVYFATFNLRFLEWLVDATGNGAWRDEGLLDVPTLRANREVEMELRGRLKELFLSRDAIEWEDLGKQVGFPLAMCRTPDEWIDHEHARAARIVLPLLDPELGEMWQPGFAVSLSATPAATSPRHALDADRDEVLAGLAEPRPDARLAPEPPVSAPLQGMRVIDTTQVLAGPSAGRWLADFGADVIKVSNPVDNGSGTAEHLHLNRGKRTMLIDIAAPEGLDVLYRLVKTADVFMQNFTNGQAAKLGIDYESITARRPGIVYSSVSAYNYDGPWAGGRGYEPMGHAVSGNHLRSGGDQPLGQPFAINDYGTGVLGAFSIVLGLFHKVRTAEGQHVQASLAQTGTYHQTPYFARYEGKVWDEPRGITAIGTGPLNRLYRGSDAWFFLAARPAELQAIAAIEGLGGIEGLSGESLAAALEERFTTRPAAHWVEHLQSAGAGAHRCTGVAELMEDSWVKAHGLSVTLDYEGSPERSTGSAPRFSRTPLQPVRFPLPYGGDGPALLEELGFGDRALDLADRGIVPSRTLSKF